MTDQPTPPQGPHANLVARLRGDIYDAVPDDNDMQHVLSMAAAALSAVAPTYRFAGRATGSDPEGYYFRNWEEAQAVSVVAHTKDEAWEKAIAMLGTHPRFGRKGFGDRRDTTGWAIIWDRIDEEATS